LFDHGVNESWLDQCAGVSGDLFFVMDEGWDLPDQQVMVVAGRFPSYAASNQVEAFRALSDAIKNRGWRGLGLWMRADAKTDDFWIQRLQWMNASGVSYWKVDYGDNDKDEAWRQHLTDLGRKLAPNLTIETAMTPHAITWADTYRTYDVDALVSIPQTLNRVVELLQYRANPPAKGLINCEDEVYLGTGLGCCYGVMRHNYAGSLPGGRQDFVFPPLTRDLKHCQDEVVRAVRWRHIAPAFAVGSGEVNVSDELLTDNWFYKPDESWEVQAGGERQLEAPASVTRCLPIPVVSVSGSIKPYVVAARYPNGAVAIATLGRAICHSATERQWITGEVADVALDIGQYSGPIGIFGRYHSLTIDFSEPISGKILMQDLASDSPVDVTARTIVAENRMVIPGDLIDMIGKSASTPGDKSDPGIVLAIEPD